MLTKAVFPVRAFLIFCLLIAPSGLEAQRQRQLSATDEGEYGSKFFDQLRTLFGRFHDTDLQRAFQTAEPIQCPELVINKGEWRTVAFFNEDRSLGEWCRNSLEEVKTDLSVYTFKGTCRGDQGTIQVTTEFPIGASVDSYNAGRIRLDQVDVNVNDPVSAVFDTRTQAYRFELPYLFLTGRRSAGNLYSLMAPNQSAGYAPDVTNRWECKAVKSNDVTYRFLICRTATVARGAAAKNQSRELAFGASAFFILSDGVETHTSVNLSFGDSDRAGEGAREAPSKASSGDRPSAPDPDKPKLARGWQMPDVHSSVVDATRGEFRLRFSPQTWAGKLGSPELLTDQKMSSLPSGKPQDGADYCTWRPEAGSLPDALMANEPQTDISYSAEPLEKTGQSPASLLFYIKTRDGARLGTLQCFFPRSEAVANVTFDRWVSIVGGHLSLETR